MLEFKTMSRSFRTEKPIDIAQQRIVRDKYGSIVYPSIIEKKPKRGDIHPLNKSFLSNILKNVVPIEYLYGLNCIELRARETDEIGNPYGSYCPGDKTIRLFSLPMIWNLDSISHEFRQSIESFDAVVSKVKGKYIVEWLDKAAISMWFYTDTITHELGHHFRYQYRHRKKAYKSIMHEEIMAEMHSRRLTKKLFERLRRKGN